MSGRSLRMIRCARPANWGAHPLTARASCTQPARTPGALRASCRPCSPVLLAKACSSARVVSANNRAAFHTRVAWRVDSDDDKSQPWKYEVADQALDNQWDAEKSLPADVFRYPSKAEISAQRQLKAEAEKKLADLPDLEEVEKQNALRYGPDWRKKFQQKAEKASRRGRPFSAQKSGDNSLRDQVRELRRSAGDIRAAAESEEQKVDKLKKLQTAQDLEAKARRLEADIKQERGPGSELGSLPHAISQAQEEINALAAKQSSEEDEEEDEDNSEDDLLQPYLRDMYEEAGGILTEGGSSEETMLVDRHDAMRSFMGRTGHLDSIERNFPEVEATPEKLAEMLENLRSSDSEEKELKDFMAKDHRAALDEAKAAAEEKGEEFNGAAFGGLDTQPLVEEEEKEEQDKDMLEPVFDFEDDIHRYPGARTIHNNYVWSAPKPEAVREIEKSFYARYLRKHKRVWDGRADVNPNDKLTHRVEDERHVAVVDAPYGSLYNEEDGPIEYPELPWGNWDAKFPIRISWTSAVNYTRTALDRQRKCVLKCVLEDIPLNYLEQEIFKELAGPRVKAHVINTDKNNADKQRWRYVFDPIAPQPTKFRPWRKARKKHHRVTIASDIYLTRQENQQRCYELLTNLITEAKTLAFEQPWRNEYTTTQSTIDPSVPVGTLKAQWGLEKDAQVYIQVADDDTPIKDESSLKDHGYLVTNYKLVSVRVPEDLLMHKSDVIKRAQAAVVVPARKVILVSLSKDEDVASSAASDASPSPSTVAANA